jgi:hypothetical protein
MARMDLVALELTLAPLLMAAATLVARRFGPAVASRLVCLPLTTGPLTLCLALEHGPHFAAGVAMGNVAGVGAQAGCAVAYAHLCRERSPAIAAIGGVAAFATLGAAFAAAPFPPAAIALCAVAAPRLALLAAPAELAVAGGFLALPSPPAIAARRSSPGLPARMLIVALLVLVLANVAPALGPHLSGVVSVFPMFGTLLAVFAHRDGGPAAAVAAQRGFIGGLLSVAGFGLTLALLLGRVPLALAFALALAAAAAPQGYAAAS